MSKLLIFLMAMSMIACSGSKSVKKADSQDLGVELTDSEDFVEDTAGEEIVDAEAAMAEMEKDSDVPMTADALEGEQIAITGGGIEEYTVAQNETLMIIAFKIYGDYSKWRELQELNSQDLSGVNQLAVGMKIKYNAPAERFVWNPEGNPYMIKQGDTLGTISSDTYGTDRHWRDIWDNNKPLIKDPNKIFAGFTLYTPIIKERGVANKM